MQEIQTLIYNYIQQKQAEQDAMFLEFSIDMKKILGEEIADLIKVSHIVNIDGVLSYFIKLDNYNHIHVKRILVCGSNGCMYIYEFWVGEKMYKVFPEALIAAEIKKNFFQKIREYLFGI